jgi:hypothetical protein
MIKDGGWAYAQPPILLSEVNIMAFKAEFYTIKVPPSTLDKGEPPANAITCNCTPFNSVSGLNGNILIDYNAAVESCNYCKIT